MSEGQLKTQAIIRILLFLTNCVFQQNFYFVLTNLINIYEFKYLFISVFKFASKI